MNTLAAAVYTSPLLLPSQLLSTTTGNDFFFSF